jgi:NIMA (never in mitosis gene a)-related kinase
MKRIDITNLDKKQQADAVNEVQVLSCLKHPYIVRYHESFLENGELAIVMDYAEGGDLARRIRCHHVKRQLFPESQILRWFTQVVLGLKYLHKKQIVHRDLKPQNIFLTKQDDLRLGDFGISKISGESSLKEEKTIGTPHYFSPEICGEKLYSFASDMWALGCILYEMVALQVPFDAQNILGLVFKITGGPPPALPQLFSTDLRQLCDQLLGHDYDRRPSAAEILKRPLIQAEVLKMLSDAPTKMEESFSSTLCHSGNILSTPSASKRSPSAPIRLAAGRNVFSQSGSNVLTSSTGALKPAWPDFPQLRPQGPSIPKGKENFNLGYMTAKFPCESPGWICDGASPLRGRAGGASPLRGRSASRLGGTRARSRRRPTIQCIGPLDDRKDDSSYLVSQDFGI